MKSSLKFREEQKPLFRTKIPLSILGLPFQSGMTAGDPEEFSFCLSTHFDAGPSLKLSYRPNDSSNPFGFAVKTGIGPFGSPNCVSMSMSAEFNPLDLGNPRFFFHLKPQIGDFSIKKSQSSILSMKMETQDGDVSEEGPVEPVSRREIHQTDTPVFARNKSVIQGVNFSAADLIRGAFSGVELIARTALPIRAGAFLKCRWGVRLPRQIGHFSFERRGSHQTSQNPFRDLNLPQLTMNKIAIEHVSSHKKDPEGASRSISSGSVDMAEALFMAKHEMDVLRMENEVIKKAIEGVRSELASRTASVLGVPQDVSKSIAGDRSELRRVAGDKKSTENDGVSVKFAGGDVKEGSKTALLGPNCD